MSRNNLLNVPVELSEFVFYQGLSKSFAIFLYIKLHIGDKVATNNKIFLQLMSDLKMSDSKKRTFRKHFQKLIDFNWIGFNPQSGIYHLRSFRYIHNMYRFKSKRTSVVTINEIKNLYVYLVGVILCKAIYGQKYFFERGKGRLRAAVSNWDPANQSEALPTSLKPRYYGLSNRRIARLLGCKYTRACQLKRAADKAFYITLFKKYSLVALLDETDPFLRSNLAVSDPWLARRIRICAITENGVKKIKVVQQLRDEIVPLLPFKRMRHVSALKVQY